MRKDAIICKTERIRQEEVTAKWPVTDVQDTNMDIWIVAGVLFSWDFVVERGFNARTEQK